MLRSRLTLAFLLLGAQVGWADEAATRAPPAANAPAAVAESESQQAARTRLMEMAKLLAGTEKFSVTLRVGYDVVQDTGQKIEFGEIREVKVERPDHVRIDEQASQDGGRLMLFDGTQITTFDGESDVYAQAPQPGDLDATVVHFVRDLKMRLPLAVLLMAHFPEEIQQRVQSIEYVESTQIHGQPVHHIAARTADVDFQVWIADDKRALPLRIVLTYKQAEGQPQFWAEFSKWDLAPRFVKDTFAFKPPAGAKQIAFRAHFAPMQASPQKDEAQKTGDKP